MTEEFDGTHIPTLAPQGGAQVIPEFPPPTVIDTRPDVDTAWAAVMDQVKAVAKREVNQDQHFNFRGVDSVVNAMGPALRTHGVKVIPRKVRLLSSTEYETRGRGDRPGTRMVNRVVHVRWQVRGPRGDHFEGESLGEAADAGDKGVTKAQSVAWRVFLIQSGALPTDDTDPDSESHQRASQARPEGDYDQVPAHIAAAIDAANQARAELLAATSEYGWDEPKLTRRYWDDYRKNLRNTHDVEMIKKFQEALVSEAKAQDAEGYSNDNTEGADTGVRQAPEGEGS